MAVATTVYTNIVQGVSNDGQRSVEATVTFSNPGTDTYATNGHALDLKPLGLSRVTKAYIVAYQSVDNFYTLTGWATSQDTVTAAAFVDITTNGTPSAPLLRMEVAGAQHAAGAIAATRAFRIVFVGTA